MMKSRFDEVWSILESRKLTGEKLTKRARELVREEDGAEAGFRIADGPDVVLWVIDSNRLRYLLSITSDAPYFAGHFPGNPILPGIIQLHWAILLARRHVNPANSSVDIKHIKFRSIITPPRLVELRLNPSNNGRVEFSIIGKAGIHSQGSLVFTGRS